LFLKKLVLMLFLAVSMFIYQACSETPTGAGAGLLEQDQINVNTFDTQVDTVSITSSSGKRTINLGVSTRMLVGKRGNAEAGILIRFNFPLADTLAVQIRDGSIIVESANITMVRSYTFGEDTEPLGFNIYRVTSGWSTSTFNSDSAAGLQYEPVSQLTELSIADTITTAVLQPTFVTQWLQAAADTAIPSDNGAYIKPTEGSNKILGYYALGSPENLTPKLNVNFRTAAGELVPVVYSAIADLGFVTGDLPQVGENTLVIQAGLEAVSRLRFDLSSLPSTAIVNRAVLSLTRNEEASQAGTDVVNTISAYFMPDSLNPDSVTSSILLNLTENIYSGDITFYVQEWLRTARNAGLLLAATNRFTGVDIFAVYGEEADPALRPRLIITYTTKL
jgi:hypothetical protein